MLTGNLNCLCQILHIHPYVGDFSVVVESNKPHFEFPFREIRDCNFFEQDLEITIPVRARRKLTMWVVTFINGSKQFSVDVEEANNGDEAILIARNRTQTSESMCPVAMAKKVG